MGQELGALRLRMQWIHSLEGLVSHLAHWSDAKLIDIEHQEMQIQKEKLERLDNLKQTCLHDDSHQEMSSNRYSRRTLHRFCNVIEEAHLVPICDG